MTVQLRRFGLLVAAQHLEVRVLRRYLPELVKFPQHFHVPIHL
jgi:hypothetical protein